MEIYYTFDNTHIVILCENLLLNEGIKVKVRPLPTVISAGCGLCLCVEKQLNDSAKAIMNANGLTYSAAYVLDNGEFVRLT